MPVKMCLLKMRFVFCLNCSGLYAGIKFFLIDFIFKRCPRLRAKYDTPYIIWTNLPTDPQLKERSNATVSRRVSKVSYFHASEQAGLLAFIPFSVARAHGGKGSS